MRDGCFASFSPARRPARFPSQGGCPGLLRGYDHLERGRWNFAQSVLVDVDALDDVAALGAVHDLVLRVLGRRTGADVSNIPEGSADLPTIGLGESTSHKVERKVRYLVGQFFNALADYEVTVFEAENGRGPVIEVHDPETGKKVSVALTRTTNG